MRQPTPEFTSSYLDNNATAPMAPEVIAALVAVLEKGYGNPSSAHRPGRKAAELLLEARSRVATLLGAAHEAEIVFTSGGTESNNTALLSALATQTGRNEIVVSAIEHASILATCAALEKSGQAVVHRISVDGEGRINIDEFRGALNERTALASVQWANNETGVLQPVAELSRMAHEAGALFHCDAVQAAGRFQLDVRGTSINLLSVSAHKLHGPQGLGALYVRKGTPFAPLLHGGRQERGRRAGSENVAGIVAFGKAAELAGQSLNSSNAQICALRNHLESRVLERFQAARILSAGAPRLANTSCIAFAGMEGDELVTLLDRMGVAVSSGSACATGAMEPSHVVRAMKVPFSHIRGAVRFSFSRLNTEMDVERALTALASALEELGADALAEEAVYG
jgi:cysteine desulfurase